MSADDDAQPCPAEARQGCTSINNRGGLFIPLQTCHEGHPAKRNRFASRRQDIRVVCAPFAKRMSVILVDGRSPAPQSLQSARKRGRSPDRRCFTVRGPMTAPTYGGGFAAQRPRPDVRKRLTHRSKCGGSVANKANDFRGQANWPRSPRVAADNEC